MPEAQELVQAEYGDLGFNITFFDYSFVYPFLNLLLRHDELITNNTRDVLYQSFYNIAKALPMENLKNGMYAIILNSIVRYRLVPILSNETIDIMATLNSIDPNTALKLSIFEQNF